MILKQLKEQSKSTGHQNIDQRVPKFLRCLITEQMPCSLMQLILLPINREIITHSKYTKKRLYTP